MNLAFLIAMQAASPAAAPAAPATPIPSDFDLARLRSSTSEACRSQDGNEIVVCGQRRIVADYPLEEMARLFREGPLRAEMGIGGGATGRVYTESVEMPQGQISKRIMVGVRLPF